MEVTAYISAGRCATWTTTQVRSGMCSRDVLRRFRLASTVEGDRLANERLEGGRVNVFSVVDVDRAAYVSVETRVEEMGRILQRRALGKRKLHDILVGFASADDAVVRPNRGAGFGWFHPLPLLDDVRVCILDELAHSAEGFRAPVPELGDSFRDELRCRPVFARTRLFHVLILERRYHAGKTQSWIVRGRFTLRPPPRARDTPRDTCESARRNSSTRADRSAGRAGRNSSRRRWRRSR